MLLSLALASLMFVNPVSAQSHSVVSAESNLSDTTLTVEFSDLQADSDYSLNYQPEDGEFTQIKTFTTSSQGSAVVNFTHDPFGRDQELLGIGDNKGWLYRVETPPFDTVPDSQYSFTVLHGNMLGGLDTFNDGVFNTEAFERNVNVGNCESASVNENIGEITLSGVGDFSCDNYLFYRVDTDEVVTLNFTGNDLDVAGVVPNSGVDGNTGNSVFDNPVVESTLSDGFYKVYIENGDAVIEDSQGNIVQTTGTSEGSIDLGVRQDVPSSGSRSTSVQSVSVIPKVSEDAWVSTNRFNPADADLMIFGDTKVDLPQNNSGIGLEYAGSDLDWSVLPPDSGTELNYRNTGNPLRGALAVETGEAFQNLDITPLTPLNNTVYPIPTNGSLPVDFEYEVVYPEDVESSVTWTLSNSTTDLSSTIYPELDAPIDRTFTESATVPIGDYDWTVSVSDSSIGTSSSETFSFSVINEENATVSFDLISPSSGEEVSAEDGVDFQYEVQAENSGTLNLWIPEQSMTSPQFSETLGSGTTSRTVNLDVPSGSDLSWYLTFEEDSTGDVYTSQSVQFTTAEEGTEPEPGDGFQISIPDLFFNAMSQFGFSESGAGYLVAILLILLLSTVGFVLGGTFGGSAGMSLALVLSAIVGLLPSWVVLVVVFLAGGVTAYYVGQAVSGGD